MDPALGESGDNDRGDGGDGERGGDAWACGISARVGLRIRSAGGRAGTPPRAVPPAFPPRRFAARAPETAGAGWGEGGETAAAVD